MGNDLPPRASLKRNRERVAYDRERIARLYLRGMAQTDIAKELNVNQSTVSRDLKAIRVMWLQSALSNFDAAKAQELARIDELERTAWDGYQTSQTTHTTTYTRSGKNEPKPARQIAKSGAGDAAFLRTVQWCIEKRCQIFGFDAPRRTEITGADGGALQIENAGTRDAQIADVLTALLVRVEQRAVEEDGSQDG